MIRAVGTLLVLVGCGTPPATTATPSDPPASHGTPSRPMANGAEVWQECTEASRAPMEALLLARHHLQNVDDRIDGLTCVTVQLALRPAFFVELVGSRGDERHRMHGVVGLDRTIELVPLRDVKLGWAQQRGGKVSFETVDLDRDGTDEVLVHFDDQRQRAEWIDVVVIRGGTLIELTGPRLSYDDPDIDEACHGVLTHLAAGGAVHLVVTTTGSSGKSDHCLDNGRHEFALEGDALVELADAVLAATRSPRSTR